MNLTVKKTELSEIQHFRDQFLHENNLQFVCNKCHDYGWADVYVFVIDGEKIGYGSVWGTDRRQDRDTIFEFFIVHPYRKIANSIFDKFISLSKALYIESQSNDLQLTAMLYEFARNINAEAILFQESHKTAFQFSDVLVRKRNENDEPEKDDSPFVLERNGKILASGGLMLNYNFPYADIYLQVKEPFRKQGLGSFMVQELKKEAYRIGRVPAARCNIGNKISKATLLKAGLKVCGFRLKGYITTQNT